MVEVALSAAQQKMLEVWEHHLACEFELKSTDETLKTMVHDAYVYTVPTGSGGGSGAEGMDRIDSLRNFYATSVLSHIPADIEVVSLSRTVGSNRIVDESVFKFTHDIPVPWLLPGVAPTGKKVEIPVIVFVSFQGDKMTSERIYWDQASLLVQLGLLDRGNLPVAGVEATHQLLKCASSGL